MDLLEKIEQLKQHGCYAVNLFYGEDIGCDDLDVPKMERRVKLVGTPVGVLGEARLLYVGTVEKLLKFDFNMQQPKVITNPPSREEIRQTGFYMWGTESAVKRLEGKWKTSDRPL